MKISNESKIGALTAITITVLVLGYNFLKGNDLFTTNHVFYALYNDVDGLTKSNAVVINGFKVGQITEVSMLENKNLLVEFEVRSDVSISKFDTCRIVANDIFGTKVIQLTDCRKQPLAQEHDTLISYLEPGLAKMIGSALSPLKEKVEKLMGVIDSIAHGLNGTMGKGTQNEIEQSLSDIRQTIAHLKSMSGNLDQMVGSEASKLNQILANVASISKNLKDNNLTLSKTLKNVERLTDSLAASDIKSTITQTRLALTGLNTVMQKINAGEGSMGLLLNDKKLYDNLQRASDDLDKLLADMKANPKRYVHFSLFGKKEKTKGKK